MISATLAESVQGRTAVMLVACLVAAVASSACLSAPIAVPPVPMPEFADTEVSTNIPINKADIKCECKM